MNTEEDEEEAFKTSILHLLESSSLCTFGMPCVLCLPHLQGEKDTNLALDWRVV